MENCDLGLPVGEPGDHFPVAISFKKHNVLLLVESTLEQVLGHDIENGKGWLA
jgi:hypothetical protein